MEYSFVSEVLPFIAVVVIGYMLLVYNSRRQQIKDINERMKVNQLKFFFELKSKKDIIHDYLNDLRKIGIIKEINHESIDKVYFYVPFHIDDDSYSLYKRWTELSGVWFNPWRRSQKKLKQWTSPQLINENSYQLNFLKSCDYKKILVKGFERGKAEYLDNEKDKNKIEELYKKIKIWNDAAAEEKRKLIYDLETAREEIKNEKIEREANIKRGKKFLEELRKAPYNNDKVGQSFIKKTSSKPKTVKDTSNLKPGGKFYELFKDVPFNNDLAGKSFIRKVSKKEDPNKK